MKIIYRGPQDVVNVPPYGEHRKDQVKKYPDAFGKELLATSKRQQFEESKGNPFPFRKKGPDEPAGPGEGEPE